MADRDGPGEPPGRSWWIDALDPVENLRALVNAQGFGRRAAEDLADRLLSGNNGGSGGDSSSGDNGAGSDEIGEAIRGLRADAVSVADHLAALLEVVARGRSPRPEREKSEVLLPALAPGAESSGLFWIHNALSVPVAAVRPHATPPRSHLGDELPAGAVRFEPEVLDPLPARSSCGIEVRVRAPAETKPGTYVSVILVTNVPEVHLPLRFTVRADDAEEHAW